METSMRLQQDEVVYGNYGSGWWYRNRHGKGWELLTPRCRESFSERQGYRIPVFSLCGWRLFRLSISLD